MRFVDETARPCLASADGTAVRGAGAMEAAIAGSMMVLGMRTMSSAASESAIEWAIVKP
jgi:hypothetical protein